MTADVMSWLTATLDEVERENTPFADGGWRTESVHAMDCAYGQIEFASNDCSCGRPAWALAAVETDRAILAHHASDGDKDYPTCTVCDTLPGASPTYHRPWPCPTVRLLASGWKHMPGYRTEEWKL